MTPTKQLADLLTKLDAMPEGLYYHDIWQNQLCDPPVVFTGWSTEEHWPSDSTEVDEDHALAILRDAARRVCDRTETETHRIRFAGGSYYFARRTDKHLDRWVSVGEQDGSLEQALIAGLEWIITDQPGKPNYTTAEMEAEDETA
ncbi:MAG: hypothetical protein ABL309_13925 [Phycisphaerales bacterium]